MIAQMQSKIEFKFQTDPLPGERWLACGSLPVVVPVGFVRHMGYDVGR